MLNIVFEKNDFKFWFVTYNSDFWNGVGDIINLDKKSLLLYIIYKNNRPARFFEIINGKVNYSSDYEVSKEVQVYISNKLNLLPFA